MHRLDGYFLYEVGAALRPLTTITYVMTNADVRTIVWSGERWLRGMLQQSLINLKTSRQKGWELLKELVETKEALDGMDSNKISETVEFFVAYSINSKAQEFQTLLSAELSIADIYVIQKKGAYDLTELAENGISVFPEALASKVPASTKDANQAARCIAFDLPTAAAFHMHLVLERVMRGYYDVVTGNKPRPESRSATAYIDAMKNHHVGDKKIFAALADVVRFHRNPVLHPEDTLDTKEEAIALLGSIFSVTMQMLKVLPDPVFELVAQNAETKKIAAT